MVRIHLPQPSRISSVGEQQCYILRVGGSNPSSGTTRRSTMDSTRACEARYEGSIPSVEATLYSLMDKVTGFEPVDASSTLARGATVC